MGGLWGTHVSGMRSLDPPQPGSGRQGEDQAETDCLQCGIMQMSDARLQVSRHSGSRPPKEGPMTIQRRGILIAAPFFMFPGCASVPTPTAQQRAAISPTGKLRVGVNSGSPLSFVRDASGQPRGVLHDLARDLAGTMGVPIEFREFRAIPDIVSAMKAGQVDLTGTNATPARAADIDFARTLIEVELGYLVAGASTMQSAEDAKRPGLKVGVVQGSTSQAQVPRSLPQAMVIPVPGLAAVPEMLRSGAIDAFTTNKAALFEASDKLPGSRVLPGGWGKEQWALGLPKGRADGVHYLEAFLAHARERGLVRAAVDRSGLRGAIIV